VTLSDELKKYGVEVEYEDANRLRLRVKEGFYLASLDKKLLEKLLSYNVVEIASGDGSTVVYVYRDEIRNLLGKA